MQKKLKRQGKLDLIVIDYLQLADMEGEDGRNREQEVAKASLAMKSLAKELNVPVILLSQLNRASLNSKDKRPQLFHLRESGSIEQDADLVMFIHRESYYDNDAVDESGNSWEGRGEILVRKNREGAIGDVIFRHNQSMTVLTDDIEDNLSEVDNPF